MIATFSSPASNASDRDQLKAAAEKIMTQILLDPGYPYEWGRDNTSSLNLTAFGLARYGATSRQVYELDPDKVLRLNKTLQGSGAYFVPASNAPNNVSFLLGLGNDYGFTLEFNQTLQVRATQIGTKDKYAISVTSEYSLPVIGANVSAALYYLTSKSVVPFGLRTNRTTYDGTCIVDFGDSGSNSRALAIAVNYYGIQEATIFGEGSGNASPLNASLLDRNLILGNSGTGVSSLSDPHELILIQNSNGTTFTDLVVGVPTNPPNFLLNDPPEPSAIGVLTVTDGGKLVIAQRDFSKISYRTIQAIRSSPITYSLKRTVLVGGSTYLVTLYLWRMSS